MTHSVSIGFDRQVAIKSKQQIAATSRHSANIFAANNDQARGDCSAEKQA